MMDNLQIGINWQSYKYVNSVSLMCFEILQVYPKHFKAIPNGSFCSKLFAFLDGTCQFEAQLDVEPTWLPEAVLHAEAKHIDLQARG